MINLNNLITEIHEEETLPIDGSLRTDEQWKIEERILNVIKDEPIAIYKKKSRRKKWLVIALAATLLLALSITAIAAFENDWDVQLLNFMGLSNTNTLQLESGEVKINETHKAMCIDYGENETGVEKIVEMTIDSSIGDKNSAYVKITTDYEMPANYNPETDYVLPEKHSMHISKKQNQSDFVDYASMFTCFVEDGKLGFLLSIENAEGLNKRYISLEIKDLYIYHDLGMEDSDSEEELLCKGSWCFSWKFSYQSNTDTHYMLRTLENNNINYYLTKIEISPISIRAEAFRLPQDRQKPHAHGFLEEIRFTDGTVLKVDGFGGGGLRDGMFVDLFIGTNELGISLNLKDIKSIVICGQEIFL